MHTTATFVLRCLVGVLCWSLADALLAACPSEPPHYRVGSTATDPYCHYNTIQDAINAVPVNNACPVVIDVTREHLYGSGGHCGGGGTGCHLTIDNRYLTLQGWGDGVTCQVLSGSPCQNCGPDSDEPLVTLDGANAGGPVIRITGTGMIPNPRRSLVTLRNLTITHGNASTGRGGGILFTGNGALTLAASTVSFNTALNGGGIAFDANEPSSLNLGRNALITMNTGTNSGGGIVLTGRAALGAVAPGVLIFGNKSPAGYGGGIYVRGPARADLGSPGRPGWGFIAGNEALRGGGIAVDAGATVRLFSSDAQSPARINGNRAYEYGGGVYLLPSDTQSARLCALDFRIDGNRAAAGSAIFGDTTASDGTPGVRVQLGTVGNESLVCPNLSLVPAAQVGAVPCARGAGCNQIDHNTDVDGNGFRTGGQTLWVGKWGALLATPLAMRANEGGSAVATLDAAVRIENCLVVDGTATPSANQPLMAFGVSPGRGGNVALVRNCTFAGNVFAAGAPVLWSAQGLDLRLSMIAQGDHPSLVFSDPDQSLLVFSVLAGEIATLQPAFAVTDAVVQDTPAFVDVIHGDYHQKTWSSGVDFGGASAMLLDPRHDLDGLARVVDVANPNRYGPADLGPYELQLSACGDGGADTVYCDDFDGNGIYVPSRRD